MYVIIVKYPVVQISVPKLLLFTFDQLFYAFISLKPRVHTNAWNIQSM